MTIRVVLLAAFGSLVTLAAGYPKIDEGMMQLLLRSCDHSALNGHEFADCLAQTSRQQRLASQGVAISRNEVLESLMDEIVSNHDLRAGDVEPEERWFFTNSLSTREIIEKMVKILQLIEEEKYSDAVSALYSLVCRSELSAGVKVSIAIAMTEIEVGNYSDAIGIIYAVITEVSTSDESRELFMVGNGTVTSITLLLQAVISGNSSNTMLYIQQSLVGLIVDFSTLNQESATALATLIQAILEKNSSQVSTSFKLILSNENLNSEILIAVRQLVEVAKSGNSREISAKIIALLSLIFEDESASEIEEKLIALIKAVVAENSGEAIRQITLLYSMVAASTVDESGFSSRTVLGFAAVITALENGDFEGAVVAITVIINRSSDEFSSSQLEMLYQIITKIENGYYEEAISLILTIATSGGASSSKSSVAITVEVFVLLSKVTTILQESNNYRLTITMVEEILSNSSITISVEVREALRVLIVILSERSSKEAFLIIGAIMTGSSRAFGRTISVEIVSQITIIIEALDRSDYARAILIIEAILNGENGGGSLSIVVKNEFKLILKAIRERKITKAYAQLSVIIAEKTSSSLSMSATVELLVVIQAVSSGSRDDAIAALRLLLQDGDLDSNFKAELQIIITLLQENQGSKAMTAIVIAMIGSDTSVEKSELTILYAVLRFATAGDFGSAIEQIEIYLEVYMDSELRFLLQYVLQLLKQQNSQGAATIINSIIMEFGNGNCSCD